MMDYHQSHAPRQIDADSLELHNVGRTTTKTDIKNSEQAKSVAASEYDEPESTLHTVKERHLTMRVWIWEIICLVVAIGIIGAFAYVVSGNDNKRLPSFPLDISLNAIVAIVAAVLRSLIMLVVTEALGQARWSWFLHRNRSASRPLRDLESFTRGPYSMKGAFNLFMAVFRRGWRRGVTSSAGALALMAAFLTLVSFGTGPALQQAINTSECLVRSKVEESTIPVAQHASGAYGTLPSTATTDLILELNADFKATMYNGLTNPLGRDSAVVPVCPTGNCTFQSIDGWTHSSIGICSTCIDTSGFVQEQSEDNSTLKSFILPNGENTMTINSNNGLMAVTPGGDFEFARGAWSPRFAEVAQSSILNFTILAFSDAPCSKGADGTLQCPREVANAWLNKDRNTSYIATSCRLYPCLRHYHAEVNKGVMNETLNATVPARLESKTPEAVNAFAANYTAMRFPCRLPNEETIYTVQNLSSVPRTPNRVFYNISVQDSEGDFQRTEAPGECIYSMSYRYARSIGDYATSIFNGSCAPTGRRFTNSNVTDCSPAWWLAPMYRSRSASFGSVSRAVDLFADAVTNKLRVDGPDRSAAELSDEVKERLRAVGDGGMFVRGQVWETAVCTVPSWRWLSFPAVLVLLTVGLLIGVVTVAWREPDLPVWKANVLPLIFYGLRDGRDEGADDFEREIRARNQQPGHGLMDLRHMKKTAEKIWVGFDPGSAPGFIVSADTSGTVRRRRPHARHSDMDVDSLLQRDDDFPEPEHFNAQHYGQDGNISHETDIGGNNHKNGDEPSPWTKPESPPTVLVAHSRPSWSEADRYNSAHSFVSAQSPIEDAGLLGVFPSPNFRTLTSSVSAESLAPSPFQTPSENFQSDPDLYQRLPSEGHRNYQSKG